MSPVGDVGLLANRWRKAWILVGLSLSATITLIRIEGLAVPVNIEKNVEASPR